MVEIIDFYTAKQKVKTKPKAEAKKIPNPKHKIIEDLDTMLTSDGDFYDLMPCNPKKLFEELSKCFQPT